MDEQVVEQDVSWLGARLREPSSYTGLAAILAAFGLSLDPGLMKDVILIGTGIGGLIGFVMKEKK